MSKIDVRIAYSPDGLLGKEYNRIIEESNCEWILLLDHDLFLCNPHWYYLCQQAIKNSPKAGIITCLTNNIGCSYQLDKYAPVTHDIMQHIYYAKTINGYGVTDVSNEKMAISGMFMLINKQAWKEAGGFPGVGFFKEDNDFGRAVLKAGWKIYRMDGLYVYHLRNRSQSSWITGQKVSKDFLIKKK